MEDVWGLGLASTVALSQAMMQTNLLPDTSTKAVIVFQIWKFEPSVPLLVAIIVTKDVKCTSPHFQIWHCPPSWHLMNVLVTFNAHLSLSDTLPIDSPSFLFFYPILSGVSLPGIILCNTIYISLFTLCFDQIHLIGFYFVTWCFCINLYKNMRGFPWPPHYSQLPTKGLCLKCRFFHITCMDKLKTPLSRHPTKVWPPLGHLGPVVQGWVNTNPGLMFNQLFWFEYLYASISFQTWETKITIDTHKIYKLLENLFQSNPGLG